MAGALGLSGSPTRVDGGWALRDGANRLVVRDNGSWSYGMDCAPDQPVSSTDVTVSFDNGATQEALVGDGLGDFYLVTPIQMCPRESAPVEPQIA